MGLYKAVRQDYIKYDEYEDMIVRADSPEEAEQLAYDYALEQSWIPEEEREGKYIYKAEELSEDKGVILAEFNAG